MPAGPSAKMMSLLVNARMYLICVAERGTMVFLRVRIMIGGPSLSPVMIPSSVGSADIVIKASTAPESMS